MKNKLIVRVANTIRHDKFARDWCTALEVAQDVLAELAGELEDAERWRYWLRKHGWSGYFDDGLTNSESAADIITAIDKARES